MSDIRFINASKRYDNDTEVIRDLNLHIREGEFMVLVGPSGCAKSTTLRMIVGLENLSSGDLLIDGVRSNDLLPAERNISMVFQSYALFPNMSVRENLAFGLKIRKTDSHTVMQEVGRVAGILELDALLDRKPRQLSGGQAQRVALGRAMIRKPSAFLFDEPLSNLDAELRVQMRGEISRMQNELKTTTVYVTHDQIEAMTMGDRIAVMNKGKVMQVGAPLELYEKPANVFVAGFIGSPKMNILPAKQFFGGSTGKLRNVPSGALIGIRPEHVTINAGNAQGTARVDRIEDLGHEVLVHLKNEETGARLTARAPGDIRKTVSEGKSVKLGMQQDHVHVFDEKSGERLK